jgi:hypothetical protein
MHGISPRINDSLSTASTFFAEDQSQIFSISCLTFFAEDFGLICWQKNVRACYNFRPANLVRFAWYNQLSCNFLIDTFQQSNQLEAGDGCFACIVAISQRFLPTINRRAKMMIAYSAAL